MGDHPIHARVCKVSKERNPVDLRCEQQKRHTGHRRGLVDWAPPRTPAGKARHYHARTPAFFAWDQERPWQTETPQVTRTLEMESEPDAALERSSHHAHSSEEGPASLVVDGQEEDTTIGDSDDRWTEEDQQNTVTGKCIAVSPIREDILDRLPPSATVAVPPQNPAHVPVAEVSPSPYRPPLGPRYRQDCRLEENDVVMPSSCTQSYVAGVTTEQADRYRMKRSSGKRLRSPAKRTTLWGDLCNSCIHQSGASTNTPSVSHKRQVRSAAERTFGGSSVSRTLNMDNCNWPESEVMRGQRRHTVIGSDATNVANQAVHEFLGEREQESKQAEPPLQQVHARHRSVDNDRLGLVPAGVEVFGAPSSGPKSYRKTKRVSFGGNAFVNSLNDVTVYSQPRTLPVLADKTTQTEASLLPTRSPTTPDRHDFSDHRKVQESDHGPTSRCFEWDTTMDDCERPRKVPRGSSDSIGAALAQQHNYRRTSSHLANPIMTNPRYAPETTKFQGKSTYSTVFNDRLPWR